MKVIRISALFALMFAFNALAQDTATERKALNGTWVPTIGEIGGNPFEEKTLKAIKLVIDGEKYHVTFGEGGDRGTTKIDPTKKPKTIDIMPAEGPNKGKTIQAIYELKGDTLRVCYDLSCKSRPAEFKTKKGEQHFLATYKRAK